MSEVDEAIAPLKKAIGDFTTSELVDELRSRKDVRFSFADDGMSASASVNGPAAIIVVSARGMRQARGL